MHWCRHGHSALLYPLQRQSALRGSRPRKQVDLKDLDTGSRRVLSTYLEHQVCQQITVIEHRKRRERLVMRLRDQ